MCVYYVCACVCMCVAGWVVGWMGGAMPCYVVITLVGNDETLVTGRRSCKS